MITVKHISKSFADVQILKDVSFVFETGKTNLIIGKSGSGKSVLTKCIVGLFEPGLFLGGLFTQEGVPSNASIIQALFCQRKGNKILAKWRYKRENYV